MAANRFCIAVLCAGLLTLAACTGPSGPPPRITSVSVSPATGVAGTTLFRYFWSGEVSGTTGGRDARGRWDFGDGTTEEQIVHTSSGQAGQPPTHVYQAAGTFTVRLTITDENNQSASGETTVTVTSPR